MSDTWTSTGAKITEEAVLAELRLLLDEHTPLILEHWHYRGSREPTRSIITNYDSLTQYLSEKAIPGDDFYVWRFDSCCRDDNQIAKGKLPDKDGKVPVGGAY